MKVKKKRLIARQQLAESPSESTAAPATPAKPEKSSTKEKKPFWSRKKGD